jgi:hypothetical protein
MVTLRSPSTSTNDGGAGARRIVAVLAAGLLATTSFTLAALTVSDASTSVCGPGAEVVEGLPGPTACAHADEPPPGVDVGDRVSTAELLSREGAGPTAYEAAEELGVPTTAAAAVAGPAVPCDGDGSSGYRVQAMYVVEAGRTDRFAELEDQLKIWAAGVDDVVNRSAALSGGVRHVRYVTEPGAGATCEAKVLHVTVPAGSLATFAGSINAVQALGYTAPNRKYLMWTDATVMCGMGLLYVDDKAAQTNVNNGSNPQYARIDQGCWGVGDGAGQHSVEAHELLHTLGGVQPSAPNATASGHCTDDSDTMCYVDASGVVLRQSCPAEREYLFDCDTDDYFSTSPQPGSYLDTHWNSARSRFLIGGGDGTDISAGPATGVDGTLGVNNPAVPGLSTQVEVAPVLATGRTLRTVRWSAARDDCVFTAPTQLQSDVTCDASAAGSTTVSATLTDSTGATKTVSAPLTFEAGPARATALTLAVDGQTANASVCAGAPLPVKATVTDVATGQPVKGLSVTFTKQTPELASPTSAGTATTGPSGAAVLDDATTVATTYAAQTTQIDRYLSATAPGVQAVPGTCTATLTGVTDASEIYRGDTVEITGTLTRDVGGSAVAVAGAVLPVELTSVAGDASKTLSLGTARTFADGSYSVTVRPPRSGDLSVRLPETPGSSTAAVAVGAITVHLPDTKLTAHVDKRRVGYRHVVVVTGRLTKTTGALTTGPVTTGVAGARVRVKVSAPHRSSVTTRSARTRADGSYRVRVTLRHSGTMTVAYAGAGTLPADRSSLGRVTVSRRR